MERAVRGVGWVCGAFEGVFGEGFDGREETALRRVVVSNRIVVWIRLDNMPDVARALSVCRRNNRGLSLEIADLIFFGWCLCFWVSAFQRVRCELLREMDDTYTVPVLCQV